MNYIGSKLKLSSFILDSIRDEVNDLNDCVYAEIFGGTGVIARKLKNTARKIIVNDTEYYSYILLKNYLGNTIWFEYKDLIEELNNTSPVDGFIFENYCKGGKHGRQYFSDANGRKIDAIRIRIEEWKSHDYINEAQYYFLLASLLESADKVANTTSQYSAYLKHIKPPAKKPMYITPALFEPSCSAIEVYNHHANTIITQIEGDVLYLDPPYNHRQYSSCYHILNTIAIYDTFEPKGKTGLRDYYRSPYSQKKYAAITFAELIEKAKFKYIFVSYNNEGLLSLDEMQRIMSAHGDCSVVRKEYAKFKSSKDINGHLPAQKTTECLHILRKNT